LLSKRGKHTMGKIFEHWDRSMATIGLLDVQRLDDVYYKCLLMRTVPRAA
jgi:hypothetical protein